MLFCRSFPGEEGLDAARAFNKATSSKRQSAARRCGGRVNESYGEGSAQSVHSRGTLRVPRSSSRRMSVSTPATRRFLRTSNRRPRSGWKGCDISAHPKGEWGTSAVCSNRRYPQRSQLPILLRNVNASYRFRRVAFSTQRFLQFSQKSLHPGGRSFDL